MNKEEVIALIENLESVYVASTIGLVFISNPDIRKAAQEWLGGPNAPIGFTRKEGNSGKIYNLDEVLNTFFKHNSNINALINSPMMAMIPSIHDLIKKEGFFKNGVPEYEFLFHIRNAMSHGNRFNLINNQPKFDSYFKDFIIEKSMHEMDKVIPDFIEIADLLDLIDFIKKDIAQL